MSFTAIRPVGLNRPKPLNIGFDDVTPDEDLIWGKQIVPDKEDLVLDMLSLGTHQSTTQQHIKDHNEKVMKRAKILTKARKKGFAVSQPATLMGFGGGVPKLPIEPPNISSSFIVPILIPPHRSVDPPEIAQWSDAQIFQYVSDRDGYIAYLSSGGYPIDRLDLALNRYLDYGADADTEETPPTQPPVQPPVSPVQPTRQPKPFGFSKKTPYILFQRLTKGMSRSKQLELWNNGGGKIFMRNYLESNDMNNEEDLAKLKERFDKEFLEQPKVEQPTETSDQSSSSTGIDPPTNEELNSAVEYIKSRGISGNLMNDMLQTYKKGRESLFRAYREQGLSFEEASKKATEEAKKIIDNFTMKEQPVRDPIPAREDVLIPTIDFSESREKMIDFYMKNGLTLERATAMADDIIKKGGTLTTPSTSTSTKPSEPPKKPPSGGGVVEEPIPEPDEDEDDDKKKKKPIPVPEPRRPEDPRRPPDVPDKPEECPEDPDEHKKTPGDIEVDKTGYLKPWFLVGGSNLLKLTEKEKLQEIKDWDIFDYPIPEGYDQNNPIYRKNVMNERLRYRNAMRSMKLKALNQILQFPLTYEDEHMPKYDKFYNKPMERVIPAVNQIAAPMFNPHKDAEPKKQLSRRDRVVTNDLIDAKMRPFEHPSATVQTRKKLNPIDYLL